jgi:hypothetical protein
MEDLYSVGPVCRKRLGLTEFVRAHSKANELVAQAAIKSLGIRWNPVQRGWRAESTGQLDGALKALADAVPEVLGPNGEVIVLIERGYQV